MQRFGLLLSLVVLSLGILGLASCSRKKAPVDRAGEAFVIEADSTANALALASQSYVECGEDCNESVGMLVAVEAASVKSCTAFLAAPNLAITNFHCLPKALQRQDAICRPDELKIHFPSLGELPAHTAGCARIRQAKGGITRRQLDYALIELDAPVSRPFLELSAEGASEGEILKAYKIDPLSERTPRGRMSSMSCRVVEKPFPLPAFSGRHFPVVALGDCLSRAGNSGAPMLDASGQVRVTLQGRWDPLPESEQKILALSGLSKMPNLATATNLSCFPLASVLKPDFALSSLCQVDPVAWESDRTLLERHVRAEEWALLEATMDAQFEAWEGKAGYGLKRVRVGASSLFAGLPLCADRPLPAKEVPAFQIDLHFNAYLQAQPVLKSRKLRLDLEAREGEPLGFRLSDTETGTLEAQGELPPCGPF